MPPQAEQTGSWWGLDAVLKQNQVEFEEFVSRPPMACPDDGEPLRPPPNTAAGAGVELYCPFVAGSTRGITRALNGRAEVPR